MKQIVMEIYANNMLHSINAITKMTNLSRKRSAIYGLSGSGKTELASKYAEEHQDKIWGICFLSTVVPERMRSGRYTDIPTIGGVELTERAVKNWLMTRDLPWLLILDHVDDDEVSLMKGCVLITPQYPGQKNYGNVGSRFLELHIRPEQKASEFILKAAEEPSPWSTSVKEFVTIIVRYQSIDLSLLLMPQRPYCLVFALGVII